MLVINDAHNGVNRTGGTTPLSFALLNNYVSQKFNKLLALMDEEEDGKLLVNGDLFDSFSVSNNVMSDVYGSFYRALDAGSIDKLYLARGNHDLSKDTTKLSSFDLLGEMLALAFPNSVYVLTEPYLHDDFAVIPHAPNQDIFDLQLEAAASNPRPYLFVHANYDNGFAVESDHSLNVSVEQCAALSAAGFKHIVFAHEHQQKAGPNGVLVVGNQFPTSISDCLGNSGKRCISVTAEGITEIQTWTDKGSYFEVDWAALHTVPENAQFIRVKGEASDTQAADVLSAISQLRKSHSAFVISNAVVVEGRALDVSALEAVESVKTFNVVEFLCDNLKTDEQRDVVRKIAATRKEPQNA